MSEIESARAALLELLKGLPIGKIGPDENIRHSLAEVWDGLEGSSDQGTSWRKILSRELENLEWDPPCIKFVLERHGGTVLGSSRAELHYWVVDTSTWRANINRKGHRQLSPMSKAYTKMQAELDADRIFQLVRDMKFGEFVEQRKDGAIKINIGKVVPSGGSENTTSSRRRRFSEFLRDKLLTIGWHERSPCFFVKKD